VKQAVKKLSSNIENTMLKIRTKNPNMKVMLYGHTRYIRDEECFNPIMSWVSAVSIVTGYRLDSQGVVV
jgi:hypothetical protein